MKPFFLSLVFVLSLTANGDTSPANPQQVYEEVLEQLSEARQTQELNRFEQVVARAQAGLILVAALPNGEQKQELLGRYHRLLGDAHGGLAGVIQENRERSDVAVAELGIIDRHLSAAKEHYELFGGLADEPMRAQSLNWIGVLEHRRANHAAAIRYHTRALDLFRRRPASSHIETSLVLHNLALSEIRLGNYAKGIRLLEQIKQAWAPPMFDPYQLYRKAEFKLARAHRLHGGKAEELSYYYALRDEGGGTALNLEMMVETLVSNEGQWSGSEKIILLGLLAEGAIHVLAFPACEDDRRSTREVRLSLEKLRADPFYREAIRELEVLARGGSTSARDFPWWRAVDSRVSGALPRWKMPSRSFQLAILAASNLAEARRDSVRPFLSLAFQLYPRNLDPKLVSPWIISFEDRREGIDYFLSHLDAGIDWNSNESGVAVVNTYSALSAVNYSLEYFGSDRQKYESARRMYEWWRDHVRHLPYGSWDEERPYDYSQYSVRDLGRWMRRFESPAAALRFELGLAQSMLEDGNPAAVSFILNGAGTDPRRYIRGLARFPLPPLSDREVSEHLAQPGVGALRDLRARMATTVEWDYSRVPRRFIAHELETPAPDFPTVGTSILRSPNGLVMDAEDLRQMTDALTEIFRAYRDRANLIRTAERLDRFVIQKMVPLPSRHVRILGIGFLSNLKGTIWIEKNGATYHVLFETHGPSEFKKEWDQVSLQLVRH